MLAVSVARGVRTVGQRGSLTLSAGRVGEPSTASAPRLSANGTFLAFFSEATDLVASDANGGYGDVFVRDLSAP